MVAQSGVASPGNETDLYGAATRDAVKKFQALFIEYIGVANGVFGPKTRTVMNAVCNSEYYTSGKGQVYSGVTTQNTVNNNQSTAPATTSTSTVADTLAPSIYLRSNSTSINQGLSFRIIVTASEPIQAFTPESIIVEGGTVSDLRKLSPNSYSLLVTPNEGAKAVLAQVEADRVLDLAGNKNDNASNEIRIAITPNPVTAATTTATATTSGITGGELDSIFNKILAQVTPAATTQSNSQATTCSNGATNPPSCNNNYNQNTPNYNSGSGSNNSGQNQQNGLMNMLLLSSLMKGNGGLFGGGGNTNPVPGCSGLSTLLGNCKTPTPTPSPSPSPTPSPSPSPTPDPTECIKNPEKCYPATTTVPTPPVRPSEFGGIPKSGEIIKKIDCQKIAFPNERYAPCEAEGKASRFYLVKDLTQGSNVTYVLLYTGLAKDKDGNHMPDLKVGMKFLEGDVNKLQEIKDEKICALFNSQANPKCVESNDSKGKRMFDFVNEEVVSLDTNSNTGQQSFRERLNQSYGESSNIEDRTVFDPTTQIPTIDCTWYGSCTTSCDFGYVLDTNLNRCYKR
jgi:hypothetical protein